MRISPLRAFTVGLIATLAFLLLVGWGTWNGYRTFEAFSNQELRVQRLIGTIVHLDEVLTMSARMAAASGELRWEERYRSFEPKLDAAIQSAIRIAPQAYAAAAVETDAANRALVAMENRAFAMVREGLRDEAMALLSSGEYEAEKRVYAEGMKILTASIDERIDIDLERSRRRFFEACALAGASALMLLLTWAGVLGTIRRHLAEREQAEVERRRLEAQVQHSQKLESLGVLAGGIAHDFNNLLTVILGNSRVALEDLEAGSPVRERIQRIHSAASYAGELVEQMLTYSGKPTLRMEPLDLSRLVHGMMVLLESSLSPKCEFKTELAGALPAVEGDPGQIRQVVLNLVTNASEALENRTGTVSVRTGVAQLDADDLREALGAVACAPGEYVWLEVCDTGSGMDSATQTRVFEPFFTKKSFGRGLGLAAALGIVRGHGGVIQVATTPGGGTSFRVLFPAARGLELPPDEPSGAEATGSGGGRGCVLVVDDEEDVIEVAREFLERAGFEVRTARGGRQGIDAFREHSHEIDAVLLDLAMPDLAGDEVLEELRRLRSDVSVIVASGYNEALAGDRFAIRGISGFLLKPYDPKELVQKLRAAIA